MSRFLYAHEIAKPEDVIRGPTKGLDEFLERDQDLALFDLLPRLKDA